MASITITDIPRTTTKQAYKAISRLYRITAGKAIKATTAAMSDLLIYGTAVIKHEDGEINHIPMESMI